MLFQFYTGSGNGFGGPWTAYIVPTEMDGDAYCKYYILYSNEIGWDGPFHGAIGKGEVYVVNLDKKIDIMKAINDPNWNLKVEDLQKLIEYIFEREV